LTSKKKLKHWHTGGGDKTRALPSQESPTVTTTSIISCYNQEWFDILVLAHPGGPGILAIKQVLYLAEQINRH